MFTLAFACFPPCPSPSLPQYVTAVGCLLCLSEGMCGCVHVCPYNLRVHVCASTHMEARLDFHSGSLDQHLILIMHVCVLVLIHFVLSEGLEIFLSTTSSR